MGPPGRGRRGPATIAREPWAVASLTDSGAAARIRSSLRGAPSRVGLPRHAWSGRRARGILRRAAATCCRSSRAASCSQTPAASRSSTVLPRPAVSAKHVPAASSTCGSRNAAERSASAIRRIVGGLTSSRSLTRCGDPSGPGEQGARRERCGHG